MAEIEGPADKQSRWQKQGFEALDGAKQVDERAAETVNGPGHHNIELATAGILEHGIEPRPLVAPLGMARANLQTLLQPY